MQSKIRDAALELGYTDARPASGHPFDVWQRRLQSTPLGQLLSFEHDPSKISGWPLGEITIWAAVSPVPSITDWPEDCGEFGGFYVVQQQRRERRVAWEDAAAALGYEVMRGAVLPERAAAIRAGLGVQGLNGLLISPDIGSFANITVMLVRAAPPPDARGSEYDVPPGCRGCKRCIKACPTGAISENGLNAVMCLRHYMNRLKDMPKEDYPKMGRRIMGCESCQLVCPDNADIKPEQPSDEMKDCMKLERLLEKPDIERLMKHYTGLDENCLKSQAALAAANMNRRDLLPLVEALTDSQDEMLLRTARWAAERLR